MKEFLTREYAGVWLPYSEDRAVFRTSVETYLQKKLDDESGKLSVLADGPHWTGAETLELSYAHTPGAAILVYSKTHRLGVDVESKARSSNGDSLKLATRFFHADEVEKLRDLDEDELQKRFIKLWVQKEAYAKLTRLGLSGTIGLALPTDNETKSHAIPVTPSGFIAWVMLKIR
jgi:phosphopantetheinyl transferase